MTLSTNPTAIRALSHVSGGGQSTKGGRPGSWPPWVPYRSIRAGSGALSGRINITFIGILSVVAYYFAILESIPEASYLTLIDAFIIATFTILSAGVVLVVVMDSPVRERKVAMRAKIDRVCRWAFPLACVLTATLLGVIFFNLY